MRADGEGELADNLPKPRCEREQHQGHHIGRWDRSQFQTHHICAKGLSDARGLASGEWLHAAPRLWQSGPTPAPAEPLLLLDAGDTRDRAWPLV